MIYIYNKNLSDVVLMSFNVSKEIESVEKLNDLAVLKNGNEIIGFNIFNASKYFDFNNWDNHYLSENNLKAINDLVMAEKVDFNVKNREIPPFVVGFVEESKKLENSNKLNLTSVNIGLSENLQIVCGAKNIGSDMKVVVATLNSIMPNGLVIKEGELMNTKSYGMICSESELGLSDVGGVGILILDDEKYATGQEFKV